MVLTHRLDDSSPHLRLPQCVLLWNPGQATRYLATGAFVVLDAFKVSGQQTIRKVSRRLASLPTVLLRRLRPLSEVPATTPNLIYTIPPLSFVSIEDISRCSPVTHRFPRPTKNSPLPVSPRFLG